mmetsp:Transcript_64297/g.158224  ORF Transcript_64297/g.158224 Transcript_64297/m.158224 type:complete len:205 (-) Transcript_64297:608-1222(-)
MPCVSADTNVQLPLSLVTTWPRRDLPFICMRSVELSFIAGWARGVPELLSRLAPEMGEEPVETSLVRLDASRSTGVCSCSLSKSSTISFSDILPSCVVSSSGCASTAAGVRGADPTPSSSSSSTAAGSGVPCTATPCDITRLAAAVAGAATAAVVDASSVVEMLLLAMTPSSICSPGTPSCRPPSRAPPCMPSRAADPGLGWPG